MPEQPDEVGALAHGIAMRLLHGARGLSLVGPQQRCDRVVAHLLRDLRHDQFVPVQVQATSTSPELLREAARRAHAGRRAHDTALLLVVTDAGLLSAGMLRELDQAAEAAISPGGLKLLLCSAASLASTLRDTGVDTLQQCLETELAIPQLAIPREVPEIVGASGTPEVGRVRGASAAVPAATPSMAAQAPIAPQRGSPAQRTRPPRRRRSGLLVLGTLVLAGLLLAALVLPLHRPAPVPAVPPPTQPLTRAPVPRPVVPAPVVPAPVLPAPAVPAPAPPAPAVPTPSAAPVPALAPTPAPALAPLPVPVTVPPPRAAAPPPGAAPGSDANGAPGTSPLLLVAQPGDTLPVLYAKVYAGNTPPPYPQVVALNPVVVPGTRLVFPAPPGGWRSRP